jgi:hypothetical protein
LGAVVEVSYVELTLLRHVAYHSERDDKPTIHGSKENSEGWLLIPYRSRQRQKWRRERQLSLLAEDNGR